MKEKQHYIINPMVLNDTFSIILIVYGYFDAEGYAHVETFDAGPYHHDHEEARSSKCLVCVDTAALILEHCYGPVPHDELIRKLAAFLTKIESIQLITVDQLDALLKR